jgi:hypothetical protein
MPDKKTAIVTGAQKGIGAGLVDGFLKHFSPSSVQFKSEINGMFLCKRHQQQHLEFLTAFLRTRRPGVRIPPGAPLLVNKTKAI